MISAGHRSQEPQAWELLTQPPALSSCGVLALACFPLCQLHLLSAFAEVGVAPPHLGLRIPLLPPTLAGKAGLSPCCSFWKHSGRCCVLGVAISLALPFGRAQLSSPYHLSCLPMTPMCPSLCPPSPASFPSCGCGA